MPKYVVFRQGADEDAYLRQLGYKISTDEDTGQVGAAISSRGAGAALLVLSGGPVRRGGQMGRGAGELVSKPAGAAAHWLPVLC